MTTPIYDFLKKYSESGTSRFHMPGHKGKSYLGFEKYDITEILGADVLYSAEGIIAESEENASRLFGTHHSFYSTQGSTLAISAMLALAAAGKSAPYILAARNVHRAFISAAALLDLDVGFIYPSVESHLCACPITARDVDEAVKNAERAPSAVYITSPDYLGNIADVGGIAEVCRSHGIPLLVDNAHGAYLKFLPRDIHPITLGAAMCADSAHKTLPALTGSAYLHISKDYPEYAEGARGALALFASTSPSYLTLCSLDLCNKRLAEDYPRRLSAVCGLCERFKKLLLDLGYAVESGEPLKTVIDAASSGLSGEKIASALRGAGVEPEFYDNEYLVLMASPENTEGDFLRAEEALRSLAPKKTEKLSAPRAPKAHTREMSIRSAVFARVEMISVEDALGRVCASPTVSCPPAVPIVISGERITEEDIKLFKYYGIEKLSVLAQK